MPESTPFIAVTRTCPKPIEVAVGGKPAEVRTLGDGAPDREELLRFIDGASIVVSMFTDTVDTEFLDAAGPNLKGVCNFAVGYNNIDLEACKARGITVTNTPDAVTEGTANMAWMLIMAAARRLIWGDRLARSGEWANRGPLGMGEDLGLELLGRELLIVGAGRIGYATALRAKAFGMRVAYVARSRHIEFEIAPLAARRVSLEQGLAESDVISVHTPLTEQTRHLINADAFARMKQDAILVNTARGPVIDEAAMVMALESGKLFGVGLDVFEHEPKIHPGLIARDDVVMSPHVGSAERRFRRVMAEMIEQDAAAILEGREPANRVI